MNSFLKADIVTITLVCGLPMGTPWLLVSEDASVFCVGGKKVNTIHLCDQFPLFRVFDIPARLCECISSTTWSLKTCEGIDPTNEPVGIPDLVSNPGYTGRSPTSKVRAIK